MVCGHFLPAVVTTLSVEFFVERGHVLWSVDIFSKGVDNTVLQWTFFRGVWHIFFRGMTFCEGVVTMVSVDIFNKVWIYFARCGST